MPDAAADAVPDAAALYDWECRHVLHRTDQDVGFWLERAAVAGNPVLELACGTGRLALPLAAAGVEIVGLDRDPAMLQAARRHQAGSGPRPVFVGGDMRRFALARRFRLVFIGYNSLQLLTVPGDMVACLARARDHLALDGRVGLEVTDFQRGGADGPHDGPGTDGGSPLLPLAEANGIRLSGTLIHDLAARRSWYWRRFEGPGWERESEVVIRSLNRAELDTLLAAAGLVVVESWAEGATIRVVAAAHPDGAAGAAAGAGRVAPLAGSADASIRAAASRSAAATRFD